MPSPYLLNYKNNFNHLIESLISSTKLNRCNRKFLLLSLPSQRSVSLMRQAEQHQLQGKNWGIWREVPVSPHVSKGLGKKSDRAGFSLTPLVWGSDGFRETPKFQSALKSFLSSISSPSPHRHG